MAIGVAGPLALVELGVLLVALLAGAWWLRRRIEPRQAVGSTRLAQLSAEHALHLVELRGRTLLIATGPAGPPTLLREFEAADERSDPRVGLSRVG